MKVSIIVPDNMVVVDGVARKISMVDVLPGVHAVQWDGEQGDVEIDAPRRGNITITDLSPYQFLLERWTAAAPVVLPPPPPPTKDEEVQRTFSDRVLKAMIQEIVFRLGIAQQDFIDAVKARLQ